MKEREREGGERKGEGKREGLERSERETPLLVFGCKKLRLVLN